MYIDPVWFDAFMELCRRVEALEPMQGSGSPEGAAVASPGKFYIDTAAATNPLWVKQSGTGDTGWKQA